MKPHTWNTADGRVIEVREMDLEHLVNALQCTERNFPLLSRPDSYFVLLREYLRRRKAFQVLKIKPSMPQVRQYGSCGPEADDMYYDEPYDYEDMDMLNDN